MTTILVACDKFKGSLTAHQACDVIATALAKVRPEADIVQKPLTDGGDGFVEVLARVTHTPLQSCDTVNALGQSITADYVIIDSNDIPAAAKACLPSNLRSAKQLGILELAQAAGLAQLHTSNPDFVPDIWLAHTAGMGRMIKALVDKGVDGLLIGLGGSATHDIGLGALQALGLIALNADGQPLTDLNPANWHKLHHFAGMLSNSTLPKPTRPNSITNLPPIAFACDVNNPLTGSNGAAAVYGPQKGLQSQAIAKLDSLTDQVAQKLTAYAGIASADTIAGAGAAGGFGYGFKQVYGDLVSFIPGAELIQAWLELNTSVANADVIITGEGGFDDSSLQGKGCGALLQLAATHKKNSVQVFAGHVCATTADRIGQQSPTIELHSITPAGMPISEALTHAADNLQSAILQRYAAPD